jgi:CDP-diacylglycerol--serine O-phosphatidyltransferase
MSTVPPLRRADDDPRQKRFRRGMYLLPSLFTCGNIALGYYALSQAILGSVEQPVHFDNAAKAIGIAVVFDFMDGLIARLTNTASEFGKQLDSLADVITFGVAPAILAWMWGFRMLPELEHPELRVRLLQVGAIATFVFLIAGASRLARFNIQSNPQPSNPGRPDRKYFVGMPIPAGAGVLAAVVHFWHGYPIHSAWFAALWAALIFCAAFLMVSTWRYLSLKGMNFRQRQPARNLIFIGLLFAAIWYFSDITLFILALTYMLSGVFARLAYILKRPNPPAYSEPSEAR